MESLFILKICLICIWPISIKWWKKVWIRARVLLYIFKVSCMVITSVSGHQMEVTPSPRDRRWHSWLWTVNYAALITCLLKKKWCSSKGYANYGEANLHWATTCWDPEGGRLMAVQLHLSLESHNFIVTKSNAPLYIMLGKREQWNVLPRGRVDLQQIYHVH